VEFRAFEMPPHSQMSLVQQLLIRAMISHFWQHPYEARLNRWDTRLHDEFLLPDPVWRDFSLVLGELKDAGIPLDAEWFLPHREFRFPFAGQIEGKDFELELRTAIEPWNVLGEEAAAGGTARFVDSSLERIQVKVTGAPEHKYVFACNGRRLPLRRGNHVDERICGVRYRAWQPPSCLHPTIGVHAPLVFDVIEAQTEKAVAGCRYYVSHPAGRNPETFPVNALEAEGRRHARFEAFGHTPGRTPPPAREVYGEFPYTLDLRTDPGTFQI
jgi:uncharacterized protein (DUF2126 family)